jgi:hypothetical protein
MEANRAMRLSSDGNFIGRALFENRAIRVSLVPVGENLCNSCLKP